MRLATLHRRSLTYHWRAHLAVLLGVVVASATLTGALLVGDSVRGSLRDAAVSRLGRVDHALVSTRFFRAQLADDVQRAAGFDEHFEVVSPVILLRGGVTHAESRARVERVNVLGVDLRFWRLDPGGRRLEIAEQKGRTVVLNDRLARSLGAGVGDDVLLRLGRPERVSTETLLGRRDQTTLTLRLTVGAITPATGLGAFSLSPHQQVPANAFVPLATLQRAIQRKGRVNALLVASGDAASGEAVPLDAEAQADRLQQLVWQATTPGDLGLTIGVNEEHGYISLESDRFLIEPPIETAAVEAGVAIGASVGRVLAYLANSIAIQRAEASPADRRNGQGVADDAVALIPYSTVAAIDLPDHVATTFVGVNGSVVRAPRAGGILLNEWAAHDLGAVVGDRVRLDYYVTSPAGLLETRQATFVLRGVVELVGAADDPGFTPEYRGVTDAPTLLDWDPPFPIDLSLIRDRDEQYWDRHGTTPKALISLSDGQRLWADRHERFGRLTGVRVYPPKGTDLSAAAESFERVLRARLDVARLGLKVEPVRARALEAARGSTDFAGLFVGFSFFLIASAAMLVALLFRLGLQRRAGEVGILLATGFTPSAVTRMFMLQGLLICVLGSAIGLVVALGYAWLMLAGLRSWWSAAVSAPFLRLHGSPISFAIGFSASMLIAFGSIAFSIRGLCGQSVRSLLSGATSPSPIAGGHRRRRGWAGVAVVALVIALASSVSAVMSEAVSVTAAFFVSGTAMLVACLALVACRLGAEEPAMIVNPGAMAMTRLGLRNAGRHRSRTVMTIGLIASATFVIAALEAFRLDPRAEQNTKHSASGGFVLYGESAHPLLFDLNSAHGRASLGLDEAAIAALSGVRVHAFRLRDGDESSCLNLYRPSRPRIIGAGDAMIERGGFVFASTVDPPVSSDASSANPWHLLHMSFDDGAIPTIGDEAAVKWQLHLGLGEDLVIHDERGRSVRLRFVALLEGSALQGELVIAESRFVELFPTQSGHRFFLIDLPQARAKEVAVLLERELESFGFDAALVADRLADYFAVQNTYLSTFQMLGGLGLMLGTVGLAAVLLRNVWERRGELALMRAIGFSKRSLGWLVLAENAAVVTLGLLCGAVSALVAVAPHLAAGGGSSPWLSIGAALASVWLVGMTAGALAVRATLRAPLLQALRCE